MYSKERPELTLDVPRVEEKHKYFFHTRDLVTFMQRKAEIQSGGDLISSNRSKQRYLEKMREYCLEIYGARIYSI